MNAKLALVQINVIVVLLLIQHLIRFQDVNAIKDTILLDRSQLWIAVNSAIRNVRHVLMGINVLLASLYLPLLKVRQDVNASITITEKVH